jgi:hypothetical protein
MNRFLFHLHQSKHLLPCCISLLLIASIPHAGLCNIIHVPQEYGSLQEGIRHVSDGDTLLVATGTYQGLSYQGNNLSPSNVTLMGSGWPSGTVITGSPLAPEDYAFYIQNVHSWRITNFEITNCGDALRHFGFTKCEIDHNYMHGIYLAYWSSGILGDSVNFMTIHHNLIEDCDYSGILFGWSGDIIHGVHIYNNTIVRIHSCEGIQFRNHTPDNCIVTNNIIFDCGGQGIEFADCNQGDTQVSYNCIFETDGPFQNVLHPGPGNIFVSPQFTLHPSIPEYYFLSENSPCVDTGNPNHFYDDPDGTRSDMGAFPLGYVLIRLEIEWVNAFPGDTVEVPITISDVSNANVLSCEFTITYPPNDLQLLELSIPDSSLPHQAGWTLDYQNPSGSIHATLEGINPLVGSGLFASMRFVLDEEVLPETVWNIQFQNANFNQGAYIPVMINGGIRLPGGIVFGDVNLNGYVNLSDAAMLFSYLIGSTPLTSYQQFLAEVSNQSGITSFDGALITQHYYGLFTLFPVEGGVIETYAEGDLQIPEVTAYSGEEVEIPILIEDAINVSATQMDMTLGGLPVELTDISGPGQGAWFSRYSGGYPNYHLYLGGSEAINGNREFFHLTFQIPDSTVGTFSIQLSNQMLNETTISAQTYREIQVLGSGITESEATIPKEFSLSPAYPNPFNPITKLAFTIATPSSVSLKIYNSLGQTVTVLESGVLPPGCYERVWNASRYPSGIYFANLIAGNYRHCEKLLLIK